MFAMYPLRLLLFFLWSKSYKAKDSWLSWLSVFSYMYDCCGWYFFLCLFDGDELKAIIFVDILTYKIYMS